MASAGTSCNLANPTRATPSCSAIGFVSWQDQIVGWWNPEEGRTSAASPRSPRETSCGSSVHPLRPRTRRPSRVASRRSASGPVGIVAHVHSHLDWDAWVTTKLGRRLGLALRGCDFKNGILQIRMEQRPRPQGQLGGRGLPAGRLPGRGLRLVQPGRRAVDADPRPTWSPGPDSGQAFPTGIGDVVGVSDGFIVRGVNPEDTCPLPDGCGEMWHSSDGLTWRNLGVLRWTHSNESCCRGWAARSSPTGSGASTSGPPRATPSCRWPPRSARQRSHRIGSKREIRHGTTWPRHGLDGQPTDPRHPRRRRLEHPKDAR